MLARLETNKSGTSAESFLKKPLLTLAYIHTSNFLFERFFQLLERILRANKEIFVVREDCANRILCVMSSKSSEAVQNALQ